MDRYTFEQALPAALRKLTPEMKADWGIMTPQHMIEHLIITWKISRGRVPSKLITDKNLDKKRAWLMTDEPYEKNIEIPALKGQLMPLRYPDLESAKAALLQEVQQFKEYFEAHPDAIHTNPIFGDLDQEQWQQLHYKHSRHHLKQFGIPL